MGSSNAVALLAAGLLLLLLGAAPSAATSGGREQSRYPPPRGGGKYVRRPPGNSSGKGDSHEPSAQPVDPTISVVGVDVLSPEDVQQYRQAHITYWRTVLSKPADASPVNPSPPKPLPNFACPKATESTYADYGRAQNGKGSKGKASRAPDTYLITGSIFGPNTTFPIRRSCTLPPGRRVILNIYNDFEWYSPPLDYSLSGLVPAGVRLSPASISSLAQASSAVNASACVFITINGTQVPDIASFYQVSPFVSDMDIAPGFYQLLRDVLGVNLNGTAAGRLYRNGIRRTGTWAASYPGCGR
ncbi:hypothetical protein HYH02_007860 [Chlamydomonas schloesseri]|uniref:Uncharacterized protein n=1 Tax=Chlamydomonas schloesseri TaxID=2026947 RepID=A0A836B474_9CHLO|nr:hypothetical protein HYH02_007860 [Chlamydomonas schloesseri]|eukprot:KAG2447112.1 hypothetical protein HYH02_007860 [Chlamydomonas schloesseri]